MHQCHHLQHCDYGKLHATSSGLGRHCLHAAGAISAESQQRLYDEHVLYVLNAARINWRFPYRLNAQFV